MYGFMVPATTYVRIIKLFCCCFVYSEYLPTNNNIRGYNRAYSSAHTSSKCVINRHMGFVLLKYHILNTLCDICI